MMIDFPVEDEVWVFNNQPKWFNDKDQMFLLYVISLPPSNQCCMKKCTVPRVSCRRDRRVTRDYMFYSIAQRSKPPRIKKTMILRTARPYVREGALLRKCITRGKRMLDNIIGHQTPWHCKTVKIAVTAGTLGMMKNGYSLSMP